MIHRYAQLDIETARPELLVSRLFQKALDCTRAARSGECAGKLERIRSLRRSLDIVAELRAAIDFEAAADLGDSLDQLYEFVNARLLLASVDGADGPIDDALRVLEPLADAWQRIASAPVEERT